MKRLHIQSMKRERVQSKNMIFWQFGQSISSFDSILLIIEGILLIIVALLTGVFKKKRYSKSGDHTGLLAMTDAADKKFKCA